MTGPGERDGYALPTTLAAIAVVAIVVAAAAQQVQSSNQAVRAIEAESVRSVDAHSTEQTFLYLMMTEPMGADGIQVGGDSRPGAAFLGASNAATTGTVLQANGRPYILGGSEAVVRYFDEQSFLNVSDWTESSSDILYAALDMEPGRRARLSAALADFQDEDDQITFGGGEQESYEADHLPANRKLRSPLELCSVRYWAQTEVCQAPEILLLIGDVRNSSELNPRLANPVLVSMLKGPFGDSDDLWSEQPTDAYTFASLGLPALDRASRGLGAPSPPRARFSLVVQDREASYARRTDFELTPGSRQAPFVLRGRYRIGDRDVRNLLTVPQDSGDLALTLPFDEQAAAER